MSIEIEKFIIFNQCAYAVRGRPAWSRSKERAFNILRDQSIQALADIIRSGRRAPRQFKEVYRDTSAARGHAAPRIWLMASRVSRSGANWEISVEYFGIESEIPMTDIALGDLLHARKVSNEFYAIRWIGRTFVIEAVPPGRTPTVQRRTSHRSAKPGGLISSRRTTVENKYNKFPFSNAAALPIFDPANLPAGVSISSSIAGSYRTSRPFHSDCISGVARMATSCPVESRACAFLESEPGGPPPLHKAQLHLLHWIERLPSGPR